MPASSLSEDGSLGPRPLPHVAPHIPECERALAEAHRVLRRWGRLAIFDGDYVTTTVASYANDPLQACVDAAVDVLVHDPWLMRRVGSLVEAAGFVDLQLRGHAYTSTGSEYLVTLVERGADILAADGRLTADTAAALRAETAERVATGTFFGHIAYVSTLARKV